MLKEIGFPIAVGLIAVGAYTEKITKESGCLEEALFRNNVSICKVEEGYRVQAKDHDPILLEELCNPSYILSVREDELRFYQWVVETVFVIKQLDLVTGEQRLETAYSIPIDYDFTCRK
jgi:hypothetical protein